MASMQIHPIRVAASKSGLSPHLIRMWERRYNAIEPIRTDTNRRLYSDEDIRRLRLLRLATESGESISQIARLSDESLQRLVSERTEANTDGQYTAAISLSAGEFKQRCLNAIIDFDSARFQTALLQASTELGRHRLLEELIQPLLVEIGQMWYDGRIKVVHEHLASSVIRLVLGSMVDLTNQHDTAPLLLSTTPSGQLHEFGSLMAAVSAATSGWRVNYLGPNMPVEDIVNAARQSNARAVALSIIYPPDDPQLPLEIKKLGQMIGTFCKVIIGGRAAGAYIEAIREAKLIHVSDLRDFRETLDRLR